ncbi:MAG: heavy metal translocating P-type ATPase, partial [Phyllobacterium sp.]|uniref:heavy metal translocating P-type ATPase n=1 Tax=Phyllobacterium sp. TaxID=1871046 RepID=UPI0030EFE3FF
MQTTTVDVRGIISVLDPLGVEKQLRQLSGVSSAEVNFVSATATVTYDEDKTDVEAIRSTILECGFHCRGEVVPRHVCEPGSTTVEPANPNAPAARHDHTRSAHAGHGAIVAAKAQHTRLRTAPAHDEMAHEMGHGSGADMQTMVRDMRNRFWVALFFTVPIFIYSPMGGMFNPPAPPYGLDLELWLFVLASAAILYPSWPFFVAAWRALRNGVLNMAVLVVLSVGTGYAFSVGSTFFFPGVQFYEA